MKQKGTTKAQAAPTKRQVIASVIGAAIGVRGDAARQRDFQHGKPATFIVAGILFTVLFVITLAVVVKIVLDSAGM